MRLPAYAAASASVIFHRALVEEHLQEIAFLYAQRCHLLRDTESSWVQLAAFEDRLDAHVDGLVAADELAMEAIRRRTADGDAGELFAAVSVFCRHRRAPFLAETLKTLDLEDHEKTNALSDALKRELPDAWREFCVRAIDPADERLACTLARVLAHRRVRAEDVLLRRLKAASSAAVPPLLWSIGRTGGEATIAIVRSFLRAGDPATASAALLAGLRFHDEEAFHQLVASSRVPLADPVALGLASGPPATQVLLSALGTAGMQLDIIMGLALLGDLSAFGPLAGLLSDETLGAAAAAALQVITGASLLEEVAIPEEMTEEELFPSELQAFRERGEVPRRSDGESFGTKVRRLTRDPAVWQEWLKSNASRFVAGHRYRYGQLCTPQVLLDCLRSEAFPKVYRPWVAEELLIRYGLDLPFEADMFVTQQRRVLEGAMASAARMLKDFEAGQWYFARQLIS